MTLPLLRFPLLTLAALLLATLPLAAQEERQPADPLSGPPFVSAAAWGIFDRDTGDELWGHNTDEVRSIASITKVMTAHVVLREIEKEPALLDARLTFSERAAATRGTTSRIQAGESLTVRDLLYGLMLPSGNDASVALGEKFGQRYLTPEAYTEAAGGGNGNTAALERAGYTAFVARMNDTAAELGLEGTRYINTHGMDAEGHQSTLADQAKLALVALQNPLFQEIVNTATHTASILTPAGETREERWTNTNQLLGTEGFSGVKTGTTRLAGACLVSAGERGDHRLLVVVLGSAASPVRYVDSRNLYRFAWLQLGHEPVVE